MSYIDEVNDEVRGEGGRELVRLLENMTRLGCDADEIANVPAGMFDGVDVRRVNCWYLPPDLGGQAVLRDGISRCALSEMLGYADPALAVAMPGPGLVLAPMLQFGSVQQQEVYLGRFDSGAPTWAAFAMTEPSGGSDATHLATTARICEGGYRLSGEKCLIGNGGRASFFLVYATTDPERGQFGVQPFLVDAGSAGLQVEDDEPMLGLRAVRVARLRFDECEVPAEAILGGVNGSRGAGAFLSAQRSWEYMRPGLSALIVGAINRFLDDFAALLPERSQAQRGLASLAWVRPRAESVRLLSHHAAVLFDAGKESAAISSMAKAAAGRLAKEAVNQALLILSDLELGRTEIGLRVSRWARDFQAFELLEGTTEVHQLMVTRAWSTRLRRSRQRAPKMGHCSSLASK